MTSSQLVAEMRTRRRARGVRLVRRTGPRTRCDLRRRDPRFALLDPPTRQQSDPASRSRRPTDDQSDHGLGVYANVVKAGTLAEDDLLEFEPSGMASTPAAVARAGTTALKRGALRVFRHVDAARRVASAARAVGGHPRAHPSEYALRKGFQEGAYERAPAVTASAIENDPNNPTLPVP